MFVLIQAEKLITLFDILIQTVKKGKKLKEVTCVLAEGI